MNTKPAVFGGLELLERAVGYTLGCLQLVGPEALDNPTPCTDWSLRELLVHLDDGLRALGEALDLGVVAVAPADCPEPTVAQIRGAASELLGALSAGQREQVSIGGCPLTTPVLASVGALELAVHGWDVARACGEQRPIPPRLAAELLELAPMLVLDGERPGRFAPPLAVAGADAGDRLLAWLGRTP